jgi:hypothetical protein
MTSAAKLPSMRGTAVFAAAITFLLLARPAYAADPTFPPGSLIGLVPPAGMTVSKTFPGFEDLTKKAAIVLTPAPIDAYSAIEKSSAPDALKKQGVIVEKSEPIQLSLGKGFIIVAKQTIDNASVRKWLVAVPTDKMTVLVNIEVPDQDTTYSDAVVRAALATLALRQSIPDAEQLSLLPFKLGDLGGFHIDGVIPGRGIMLVDVAAANAADSASANPTVNARLIISASNGGPPGTDGRGDFARLAFEQIGGLKDIHITMSEPLRINGQSGYETVAQAKDIHDGNDIMVVQWLRFGDGGFLEMTGVSRAEAWSDVIRRFRAVRDGIDTK